MQLEQHPTVKRYRRRRESGEPMPLPSLLNSDEVRDLCIQAGIDDVGFVEIHRPALADQRDEILAVFPGAKTIVGLACRLNRENIRVPAHSVATLEFQEAFSRLNRSAREVVAKLEERGIRAISPPCGFPMEVDRWPEKMWWMSLKPIVAEAGLGHMGLSRLVLHPRFGGFVVVGMMLLDREVTSYDRPLDYNPCVDCKLCASVCPVGAIASDGHFDFSACYTHNYRERVGGFSDWIENIVKSRSVPEYRRRVTDAETVSMWQNLTFGGQTRCDRCMAVCPAGEEVVGEYLSDRKSFARMVKRFREQQETVYVLPGTDAEVLVERRTPHKHMKRVFSGLRPSSARSFLTAIPLLFQRNQSEGLSARYHFTFTGDEDCRATVVIKDRTVEVLEDHVGEADLKMTADTATWLRVLAKEKNVVWALLTRKIRAKGSPKLLKAFESCFPGMPAD